MKKAANENQINHKYRRKAWHTHIHCHDALEPVARAVRITGNFQIEEQKRIKKHNAKEKSSWLHAQCAMDLVKKKTSFIWLVFNFIKNIIEMRLACEHGIPASSECSASSDFLSFSRPLSLSFSLARSLSHSLAHFLCTLNLCGCCSYSIYLILSVGWAFTYITRRRGVRALEILGDLFVVVALHMKKTTNKMFIYFGSDFTRLPLTTN